MASKRLRTRVNAKQQLRQRPLDGPSRAGVGVEPAHQAFAVGVFVGFEPHAAVVFGREFVEPVQQGR
jgi:hypothetical protein